MRLFPVLSLSLIAGCAPAAAPPGDAGLPPAAIAAFQSHVQTLGKGVLNCTARSIEAAHRVSGYINDDDRPDYAIDTRDLRCTTSDDSLSYAYFCGRSMCSYPALVSEGDGWRVIPLMSGNAISVERRYQDSLFIVRQMNAGDPGRDSILVREYGWRDGELVRLAEYAEGVDPQS